MYPTSFGCRPDTTRVASLYNNNGNNKGRRVTTSMPRKRKITKRKEAAAKEEKEVATPRRSRRKRGVALPVRYRDAADDEVSDSNDGSDSNNNNNNQRKRMSIADDTKHSSHRDNDSESEDVMGQSVMMEDESDKEDDEDKVETSADAKPSRRVKEENHEDSDQHDEEFRPKKKAKSGKNYNEKCEHCGKAFKNEYGLKYHLENNVCREDVPKKKKLSTGKRKKSDASGKAFPRIRGKEEDRTCPRCSKKFTSILGCQYHVRKLHLFLQVLDNRLAVDEVSYFLLSLNP